MCKVIVIPNADQLKDLKKLVNVCHSELMTERDGFGWAVQTADNKIHGERTNDRANFKSQLESPWFSLPFATGGSGSRNTFGSVGALSGTQAAEIAGPTFNHFMAHGRISTNNKALPNVHPIIKGGWAAIHNGVVEDHGPKYQMLTDNDSEHVLERFMRGGIKELSAELTGYYAAAIMAPTGVLTVVRDSIARLHVAEVKELSTFIYATTEQLIKDVCRRMDWSHSEIVSVDNDRVIYHAPNRTYTWAPFTSRGKTEKTAAHAMQSLGFSLDGNSFRSADTIQGRFKALQQAQEDAKKEKRTELNPEQKAFVTSHGKSKEEKRELANFFKAINSEKVTCVRTFGKQSFKYGTEYTRTLALEDLMRSDVFDAEGFHLDPFSPSVRVWTVNDFGYSDLYNETERPRLFSGSTTAASASAGL